jgi:dipeptidyl-peptidase-4
VHALWVLDTETGDERCVVDPGDLAVDAAALPPEERARRERVRESGGGIVVYATDREARMAVFSLGGQAFVADLATGGVRRLDVDGPVVDARPDPTGARVAFVRDRALHVVDLAGGPARRLVGEDDPDVSWGLAEFVAAEEMSRTRGYWWAPDGEQLAVARVDIAPVQRWHLADPVDPATAPMTLAYPAAGTPNADVTLAVVDLDRAVTPITWDRAALPYLVSVTWEPDAPLTLRLQSRDQRRVETRTGDGEVLAVIEDADWVDLVSGVPRSLPGRRLVDVVDDRACDTRRLTLDGAPVTPPDLQVRRVVAADDDGIVFTASGEDPAETRVWRLAGDSLEALTPSAAVADAAGTPACPVLVTRSLDEPAPRATVAGHVVASRAETPTLRPRVELLTLGARRLRAALVLPTWWMPDDGPLPVLLDPYGGPNAQRVVCASAAYLVPQWFANVGLAVLVVDGRGTPGRGPAWERAVAGDLAGPALEDQVDALHAAAAARPGVLDLDRVAVRGWSFGGFLAALAVLRRPDVFAAAIAGAPVTDWRLYDTHYTERYLGDPATAGATYRQSSLLDDAPRLSRPLLLIHGLADDNVVAAHTLRLSRALLEAGRPHQVLPLSQVTHMTPQESVAEHLLGLQAAFLADTLVLAP